MRRPWGGSGGVRISSSGPLGCSCASTCAVFHFLWLPRRPLLQVLTLSSVSCWTPHVEFLASCGPSVQPGKYLKASSSSPKGSGISPVASQPLIPLFWGFQTSSHVAPEQVGVKHFPPLSAGCSQWHIYIFGFCFLLWWQISHLICFRASFAFFYDCHTGSW